MTKEQLDDYMRVVDGRLWQLNAMVRVVVRYKKNEMSSELAMHELEMILTEENR